MEIRHIVLFSFAEETSRNEVDDVIASLNELPSLIPEIKTWAIYEDEGGREHSFTHTLVATFDDMAAVEHYLAHPDHVKVVERALPLMTRIAEHDHFFDPTRNS